MEIISWLGVWYVNSELYEQAIQFFERAAEIEPSQVKWKLMVASCYRRMRNFTQAQLIYQQIHTDNPDNVECFFLFFKLSNSLLLSSFHFFQFFVKLFCFGRGKNTFCFFLFLRQFKYVSAYGLSSCSSVKIFSHTLCMHMVSLQYEYAYVWSN